MTKNIEQNNRIIIFDVDGTLINSFEGIKYSITKVLTEQNLAIPNDEQLQSFVGPPIEQSFAKFFNISDDSAKNLAKRFQTIYGSEGYKRGCLYDGIVETLQVLSENYDLYVVTNKNKAYASETLKYYGLYQFFNKVYCTNREKKEDKGTLIHSIISKHPDVANMIMIGDTIEDYYATKYNDCIFIGVLFGFGFDSKTNYTFKTVEQPCQLIPLLCNSK